MAGPISPGLQQQLGSSVHGAAAAAAAAGRRPVETKSGCHRQSWNGQEGEYCDVDRIEFERRFKAMVSVAAAQAGADSILSFGMDPADSDLISVRPLSRVAALRSVAIPVTTC